MSRREVKDKITRVLEGVAEACGLLILAISVFWPRRRK
jgi:hypothetical protein